MPLFFFLFTQVASVKVIKIATDTTIYPNVFIYTSVLNQKNLPMTNLKRDDFTIYEDGRDVGKPDSVKPFSADLPTYSLILVDVSKNMKENDLTQVQIALWKLLTETTENNKLIVTLFADTLVPLFSEGEKIDTIEGLRRFRNNRRTLREKGAKILDVVALGMRLLKERTGTLSLSAIILFSKGIDDNSRISMDTLKALSFATQIPVFTVGINDANSILPQISDATGGDYMSGKTTKELEYAYRQISFKIRQSFMLIHKTQIPANGGLHSIEVVVDNIKGNRSFISPYKPAKVNLMFFVIVMGGTIILLGVYSLLKKRRRSRMPVGMPQPVEEVPESPPEDYANPPEEKKIDSRVEEKEKSEEKTKIFYPFLPMEVKRYGIKQKIIYKGEELETDVQVEIDFNKPIKVGSSNNNDLVLPELSPEHFIVHWRANRLEFNAIDEIIVNGQVIKGWKVYEGKDKYVINPGPYVLILSME